MNNPGARYEAGNLAFRFDAGWLRMLLPSGRYLCYPAAEIDDSGKLSYEGVNQYTRKWTRLETYGGKLCVAKGTPVLTDKGWVPIERVTASEKVWDGEEWVQHKGLANQGVKRVIKAHGVWMTPDHEILTTKGWVRASQSKGLNRLACRIPDDAAVQVEHRSDRAASLRAAEPRTEVYDLIDCGPRHRFVVADERAAADRAQLRKRYPGRRP